MKRFNEKNAYIFGGSSGIGLATAKDLVRAGSRVAIFARREEVLRTAAAELAAIGGENVVTWRSLDVSDRAAVERTLPDVVQEFGGPDLLINCHASTGVRYFADLTSDDLMEMLRVNIGGAWNTIQVLLPELKARRATIANVSSVAGFVGILGYAAYSASKYGLIGLSEVLRNELKPDGIRVCVLCPPDTDTPTFHAENLTKPFETHVMSESVPVKSAEFVAKAFIRGLRGRKFLIVPGVMGKLTHFVKGIAPAIVFGVVDSDLRKARKKMARNQQQGDKAYE